MTNHRFPKSCRLLKATEFDRVFRRRRSQADGMLLLYACENDLSVARLGLVVSKKCGNAVVRNRWKRCIREAFRLTQHQMTPGLDLVVLPRPGALPTMPRIQKSLGELAARLARLLASSPGPPPAAKERPL